MVVTLTVMTITSVWKAGRDADGLRVNRPTEYVVVRNRIARKRAGLITCGSETSGDIRYVLGYNLQAYGTSSTLRLKSALNRGGTVEYIYMTDVVCRWRTKCAGC